MTVPAEWLLVADPISPQMLVTDPDDPGALQLSAEAFIGRALIRPLRRELKIDFVSATGARLIASAVGQVLGTRCDTETTTGELPWRTEFGSQLYRLRNKNNSIALVELARRYVVGALERWVPRVRVTNVRISRQSSLNGTQDVLSIRVFYKIVDQRGSNGTVLATGLETGITLE